jgi:choice-of-anchor A domain-containing protein
MSLSQRLLTPTTLLATFLLPSAALATTWTHSWCTSGDSLQLPAPTGVDANIVNLVTWVCGDAGLANCCAAGGHWTMECTQRGAERAQQMGWIIPPATTTDYCGRYAWAQGPFGITEQYYPRDFNVFVLGGNISTFQSVQGPVAASGNVTATSFNLNGGRQEQVALLANGTVTLSNGTVYGQVVYGTTNVPSSTVAYIDPSPLATVPQPPPMKLPRLFDFASASTKLNDMSGAIKRYTAPSIARSSGRLTFAGSDGELNVFSVSARDLSGTTSYVFSVPTTSSVIINVVGNLASPGPTIQNAGFSGPNGSAMPIPANRILWNFPDATSLLVQSVGLPGSVLAPKAAAAFKWGSVTGTIVAKSVSSSSELYMARYQVPSPGGCLWADAKWSCSVETALDGNRHVAGLAAEAGFLQIDGGSYIAEGVTTPRTSPTHRVWYSFQPALYVPKGAPLMVLFNGGPGTATSSLLFAFNTGTMTLDPDVVGNSKIGYNSNAWSQIANLLYIDAPGTGFSYPMPYNGANQDLGIDIDRDAGTFLRVISRFLLRHPALQDNRVILVGESYGGTRATLMLNYLYNYQLLKSDSGAPYRDADLLSDLTEYFTAAFPSSEPSTAQILSRFGHQVLISPAVVGYYQYVNHKSLDTTGCLPLDTKGPCYGTACPVGCWQGGSSIDCTGCAPRSILPNCDPYDCDKPMQFDAAGHLLFWYRIKGAPASQNLNVAATLSRALGVDALTIQWMKRTERVGAYGRDQGFSSADMIHNFGDDTALPSGDNYFVEQNDWVNRGYGCNPPSPVSSCTGIPSRDWDDVPPSTGLGVGGEVGFDFTKSVQNGVWSFITATRFDRAIFSPGIALALNDLVSRDPDDPNTPAPEFGTLVSKVEYASDGTTPVTARPGLMRITYRSPAPEKIVVMPTYTSGHSVTFRVPTAANPSQPNTGAQLLADMKQWYISAK